MKKKILLGTSDAWSTRHLSQQPSKPTYYIVDCWIYNLPHFLDSMFIRHKLMTKVLSNWPWLVASKWHQYRVGQIYSIQVSFIFQIHSEVSNNHATHFVLFLEFSSVLLKTILPRLSKIKQNLTYMFIQILDMVSYTIIGTYMFIDI